MKLLERRDRSPTSVSQCAYGKTPSEYSAVCIAVVTQHQIIPAGIRALNLPAASIFNIKTKLTHLNRYMCYSNPVFNQLSFNPLYTYNISESLMSELVHRVNIYYCISGCNTYLLHRRPELKAVPQNAWLMYTPNLVTMSNWQCVYICTPILSRLKNCK